jgi:hypothetical protein
MSSTSIHDMDVDLLENQISRNLPPQGLLKYILKLINVGKAGDTIDVCIAGSFVLGA